MFVPKKYFLQLQDEYKELKKSLAVALSKPNTAKDIPYLLKETFANRRAALKRFEGRPMYTLCQQFPVLTHSKFVSILSLSSTFICQSQKQFILKGDLQNAFLFFALIQRLAWLQVWQEFMLMRDLEMETMKLYTAACKDVLTFIGNNSKIEEENEVSSQQNLQFM